MQAKYRKMLAAYIACIFFSLLCGLFIYTVFRPDTFIAIRVRELLHLSVSGLPGIFPPLVNAFLRNFACDILWAAALTLTVALILGPEQRVFSLAICIIFEVGLEAAQITPWISGTFDVLDIVLESVTTIIIMTTMRRNRNEEEY